MRARLAAMMLSLLLGALVMVATAGAAFASPASTSSPALAAQAAASSGSASSSSSGSGSSSAASDGSAQSGTEGTPTLGIQGTIAGPVGKDGARGPIAGVKITVAQDGTEIGTATTDEDGKWLVEVPKPGTYQVTLDVSTLPKSVQLREAGKETLPGLVVQPGSVKVALFGLVAAGEGAGAAGGGGGFDYGELVADLYFGLRFGLIIAMTAVGLSLIFGTTRLINFAHGEMVTIGAVVAYLIGTQAPLWLFVVATIVAIVAVGFLGGALELVLWRPLRKIGSGLIQMFIISIGVSLLLRHGVLVFFGGQREQYRLDAGSGALHFGPIVTSVQELVIIIISIVVLIGVALMLQRTRMGKAMRALSDNSDLAEASGIDVNRVILQVWILGGGLAALGGVFLGLTTAVYWQSGFHLLLLMFAGVILGGLGSAYGAMVGSIIVGMVAQLSTIWFPAELQYAWAMLVLIVVLLVRPQGILGRLQRAG